MSIYYLSGILPGPGDKMVKEKSSTGFLLFCFPGITNNRQDFITWYDEFLGWGWVSCSQPHKPGMEKLWQVT